MLNRKSLFITIITLNVILFLLFFILGSYPTIFIILHLVSIIVLWISVFDLKTLPGLIKDKRKDLLIVLLIFIFALIARIYLIDTINTGIQDDEIVVAQAAEYLMKSPFTPFITSGQGHGTFLYYLISFSLSLFGKTIFALRLPSAFLGALDVAAFYLLLRLFFTKRISFLASLIFSFSYAHIVISKLAYEATSSIFFQILSFIFLALAIKKKKMRYFVGLGLALGLGNYTYLNFHLFTVGILLFVCIFTALQNKKIRINGYKPLLLTLGALFAATVPLSNFALTHFNEFTYRMTVLSPFNHNNSSVEIVKNVIGNSARLYNLFLPMVNLNEVQAKYNPARSSMFDIVTFLICICGVFYIFKKKRWLSLTLIFFVTLPIVADILSVEVSGTNFGFNHPNFLRISGIIPLIYFLCAYGFIYIESLLKKIGTRTIAIVAITATIVGGIAVFNLNTYYNQPYSAYNYYVLNNVNALRIAYFLNSLPGVPVLISPSLTSLSQKGYAKLAMGDENLATGKVVRYFNRSKLITFNPNSLDEALKMLHTYNIAVIDDFTQDKLIQEIINYHGNELVGYTLFPFLNPYSNQADAVVVFNQNAYIHDKGTLRPIGNITTP